MENLTITEILIRMILGMLFSGILGYEREQKGRPAGFRTYIVVCMGAEIAMMTGIYLKIYMGDPDSSRIAAQVISGISFLGAGTILEMQLMPVWVICLIIWLAFTKVQW